MIKHLAPRTIEEIQAITDKEYLANRKSWSGAVKKAINNLINAPGCMNFLKINSLKYLREEEKLEIVYDNKPPETLIYNENISKWINNAYIINESCLIQYKD